MPAERKPGMDNPYHDWSPLIRRPRLSWPDGAHVALCVILSLERYQWRHPPDGYKSPNQPGGAAESGRPFPDIIGYSLREYGLRVGIFRVAAMLERLGIPATVALDACIAAEYPFIVDYCRDRGWEFIAHGVAANQMITSRMNEAEERDYIRRSIEAVAQATGARPLGWLGPEYGESQRTVALLADEGVRYVCDWPNDDQPYAMKSPTGEIYSLPVTLDLDDTFTHYYKNVPVNVYARMITDTFDVLHREGGESGRLMVLNIHPWLMGQPFRSKHMERALEHISGGEGVWTATGNQIVEWHRQHHASPAK